MADLGANTGEIASTAQSVKGSAQAIGELKNSVSSTQIQSQDFGRAHGQAFNPYSQGLQKLGRSLEAIGKAGDDYSNKLNSAARSYEWDDSTNAADLKKSGGGH